MVPQRIGQLNPRHDSIDGAADAYFAAQYDECLSTVHDDPSPAAVALCARSLIRIKRESEAIAVLNSSLKLGVGCARAAEMLALRGTAELCIGRFPDAAKSLEDARSFAYQTGFASVQAEVEYATAILDWSLGRYDEMESDVQRILALTAESNSECMLGDMQNYVGNLSEVRAKAFDLLGARAAVRENYDEQAALIMMAFEQIDASQRVDQYFESRLLLNLAVVARDLDLADSFAFVSKRLESFVFTPYTLLSEFHIRRALGWYSANRGNHLGAFRQFRLSAEAAPSTAWRIIAVLDRALLARELHEQHSAQEELDHAVTLCKSVDWQSTRDEERNALFVLAQHLAAVDATEARSILDRHASIATPMPVTSLGSKDRRLFADLSYATAQVMRAEGNLAAATSNLLDCYEIWTQIGYVSRAAWAAADLAELTENRHYFAVALREAQLRPNSWFANRLRSIAELAPI